MISKFKRRSIIGLSSGVFLFGSGLVLAGYDLIPRGIGAVLYVVGVGLYIWGCVALAKARGYSTAIVLTAFLGPVLRSLLPVQGNYIAALVLGDVLGLLFPVVVLLALPDKNGHRKR